MNRSILFLLFVLASFLPLHAQVGIGTTTPNPNAVLELVSPGNNQGVLVPKLTTAQRNAITGLTSAENGLLVFDSDLNEFFYWNVEGWAAVSEPQDLVLLGNTLSITGNPFATPIDLAPFAGTNTDNQNLSVSSSGVNRTVNITGGTGVTFSVADNDNSTTNEIQSLSFSAPNLSISGGNSVNLSGLNSDSQNLTFTNPNLSISGGNSVNLSVINTDNQNLSLGTKTGTSQPINISGGTGVTIDVADNDNSITNEIQNLSLGTKTGTNQPVNISGGGTGVTIDVADNDNSVTNEIQNLSLGTKTGTSQPINISGGGTGVSIDVADNDNSATNEIQNLTLSGNTLALSGSTPASVSLAGFLDNTDSQNLSLGTRTGTTQPINITNGTGVSIDVADNDNSATNEIQNLSLGARSGTTQPVNISGGGSGVSIDVADNDNSITNEIQNLSVVVGGAAATLRTINISGGGTSAQFDVADGDNSSTNEIQSLSINANQLSISGGNTVTLPSSSGVGGSGNTGQVAYWSGTSAITGNSNLFYDEKVPGLGIGVTPLTTLHNGGSLAVGVTIANGTAYDVLDKDYLVIVPLNTLEVNLPDAIKVRGRVLVIKVTSSDDKGVTIRPGGGGKDTIDGASGLSMRNTTTGDLNCVTLIAVGDTQWAIVSKVAR